MNFQVDQPGLLQVSHGPQRGLAVTPNADFLLMIHTKQLLLVTFCETTAGIGASFWTHRQTADGRWTAAEGQTYVEVEIVI